MSTQPGQMGYPAGTSLGATPTVRKSWFSRNWKWLIPVILIFACGLPLALMGAVFAAMKNSDAAKESVFQAQTNPQVVNALGTPIAEGWLLSGSINTSTTSGDADLAIPISGPKGRAKIYVTARKVAGTWNYSVMEVAVEGRGTRINLLSNEPAKGESLASPVSSAQPAVQPTGQPAAEQAGVIQTQETNQEGLVAELTECRRSEGVLSIKVRFRNTSTKPSHLKFTNWNAPGDNEKFYVTADKKKYFMLKDSEGTYLSSNSASNPAELNLEPGQTFLWWAKYPAPSADVKKINFMMSVTPPFEDIPITDK